MPQTTRPTAGDAFSTRAGTLLHDPLTPIADCNHAIAMEEHRPAVRLVPPEPLALDIPTVAPVQGVKWRHGWQPCEPANGVDGPTPAASLPSTDKETSLRTIVADADPLARRVVKDALQTAGLTVIAEARNGREAVELALHYRPDVLLMDAAMPELDGILATRRILATDPTQRIVIITATANEELGLHALLAGAAGFVSKDVDPEALPRALRAVQAGEAAIPRRLTRRLVELFRQASWGAGLRPVNSPLTTREWEVLHHLRRGHSTDAVAAELVLSVETVRSHIKSIFRKLGVHSREAAVSAVDRMLPGPP